MCPTPTPSSEPRRPLSRSFVAAVFLVPLIPSAAAWLTHYLPASIGGVVLIGVVMSMVVMPAWFARAWARRTDPAHRSFLHFDTPLRAFLVLAVIQGTIIVGGCCLALNAQMSAIHARRQVP